MYQVWPWRIPRTCSSTSHSVLDRFYFLSGPLHCLEILVAAPNEKAEGRRCEEG